MKALLEESTFLSLGDQTGLEKLVWKKTLKHACSCKVEDRKKKKKKLAELIIKVRKNPRPEIEGLLSKKQDSIHQLYKGQNISTLLKFSPKMI